MKYFSLNNRKREALHIKPPHKGMDLTKPTAHLEDGMLSFCKNMIFSDGVFKTRDGLKSDINNIFNAKDADYLESCEYRITDTEIFYEGENRRIAYATLEYDISHYYILVYLIGEKQDIKYIGYMRFARIDGDTFFVPTDVVFYTGAPQDAGGGIFAFVTRKNIHDESKISYSVYEVNEDLSFWQSAYRFYIPTVYINGRGNSYELAKAQNNVSTLKPTVLEAPNMLYNCFYAYYTSDGCSSSFRLPFTDIAESGVTCRIYTSLTEYTEWSLYSDVSTTAQNFKGSTVSFNIDRKTGTFYFTSNGADFSIPIISAYRENNIRIMAQKEYEDSFNSVVSCMLCATVGNTIVFSGGKENNRVYYTNYDNPLYFPKIADNIIGYEDEKVEGLYTYADTVYAYKDGKLYSAQLTNGKSINSTSLLADNGKIFYENYGFKVNCISDKIVSIKKDTVSALHGKLIWQGKDGEVYYEQSSGKAVKISGELSPVINEFGSYSFATVSDGKYMLFCKNKALVFDFTQTDNISRYYWEFPSSVNFCGCANIGGNLVLLCSVEDSPICYTATLLGNEDVIITNTLWQETNKIQSFARFKSYYLGESSVKKNIYSVFLQLSLSGKTKIKIGDGNNSEEFILKKNGFSLNYQDTVKLIPDLCGVDLVDITLDSESGMVFKGAEIYYTKIGN